MAKNHAILEILTHTFFLYSLFIGYLKLGSAMLFFKRVATHNSSSALKIAVKIAPITTFKTSG